jgi:EAL domain-containing protein (putative c-di-GMP-specific phosphodiesterase class I)
MASSSTLDRDKSAAEESLFLLHLDSILGGQTPVVFHYQPIVDLTRGTVAGYELLVRLPQAMGANPEVCLGTASRLGKRLVLEAAISRAALASRALLPPNCFLSMNVSPAFLLSEQWQQVLSSIDDLSRIVIEITEEESIKSYELTRIRIAQIRDLGGSVAVDDAGAGYASLKHIIEMNPTFIKLDRTFIANCNSERAKSTLIEMIGRAAGRLDAWIIAEGIENLAELEELMQLGVPLGQGFYLGRPNPEMQPLAPQPASDILSRNQRHQTPAGLLRHVQYCPVEQTSESAATLLLGDLALENVVVTDKWHRPAIILERHPTSGVRHISDVMKIQVASDPAEILHRALTRPFHKRFDPFAVIDNRGSFLGIVSLDRLMRALLQS